MRINLIKVKELFIDANNWLFKEYEEECGYSHTPEFNPSIELYERMEAQGSLVIIGVFIQAKLVGFAILLTHPLPHYSIQATSIDAIFISKGYRKYNAGKNLFNLIENYASSISSKQLVCSAPLGGSFDKVAKSFGLIPTSRVYGKAL